MVHKYKGLILDLSGVKIESSEVFKILSEFEGDKLSFSLSHISEEIAGISAKVKVKELNIQGLQNLGDKSAEKIAKFNGRSLAIDAKNISDRAAESLAEFKGASLTVNLDSVDIGGREMLTGFKGHYLYLKTSF